MKHAHTQEPAPFRFGKRICFFTIAFLILTGGWLGLTKPGRRPGQSQPQTMPTEAQAGTPAQTGTPTRLAGDTVTTPVPAPTQRLSQPDQVPEGLAASDWRSIRQAYDAGNRKVFERTPQRWMARNKGQQYGVEFDGRGFAVHPDGGNWQWGLELTSYGMAGTERAVETQPTRVSHAEDRVSYEWDGHMQEWFVNGPAGLEQGWTLATAPAGGEAGRLHLNLAVRGELRLQVGADRTSVGFREGTGVALNYGGLKAWDANGKLLPAWFEEVAGNRAGLRVAVETTGAVYPITVDPVVQQAYLKASNTGFDDRFGISVSVSGDTVVVGAENEGSNATGVNGNQGDDSAFHAGAAYVFVRSGGAWSQQAYLKASNTNANDFFGHTVAVSGDTVAVGAPGEDSNTTGIDGNQADNSASFAGAVYVFVRSGTVWSQQAYLKASNTNANDFFAASVAVSGDTVVVGAVSEDSNAAGVNGNQADNSTTNSGAVYVFTRSGTTWSQQAYLKASNPGAGDEFGISVSVSGDTAVAGTRYEDSNATGVNGNQADNSATDAGAAYVFVRSGTTWSQQAYLKASNTGAGDYFGFSVSVSGDTVAVGAFQEDSNATGTGGNQADNSATDAGAAYVFVRSGTTWSQQAYLKAYNTNAGDNLGVSVAVSGDIVVVGALFEDSNATGVNGNQANNSASNAGAACVFVRNGTTWSQQSYLKASNTDAGDRFGEAVAVSGDTVVVSSTEEDGNATGVNGNQAGNTVFNAGAAYTFVVSPPTVASINRTGGTTVCNGTSVSWTVTFTDLETGVSASNFNLVNGGLTGPGITSVTGAGTTWTVTASTGTGSGTLGLDLVNSTSIFPQLTGLPITGQVYTVLPPVTVSPTTLPDGVTGTAYSQNLSASGTGPFTFAQTGGTLPSGLTLSSGGVLSGNPTVSGNYSFTVTATGAGSCTGSQAYTVNITRQLNASATVTVMGTSSNMTPSTGFIGDFTITTMLQNTGGVTLNGPVFFRVTQLQAGGNTYRLKTADDFNATGPGGGLTGSQQAVPGGPLAPSATRTVSFTVGIATIRVPFQLFVDLYAVNGTSPRADKVGSYSFAVNQKFGVGGGSFGTKLEVEPEAVSETAVLGGIGTQASPVLATHPTNPQRFAVAADDYLTRTVVVRWTDNGGASWRTQALSRVVNGREYFVANAPTLAYTPQGDLVAVYTLGNLEDSANALVVSHFGDRLTFTPPTALVEYSTGQRKFVGRSSLAVNSLGTPFVAWETVDTLGDRSTVTVGRALGTNLIQTTVVDGTVSHPVLTVGAKDALYLGWQEWTAKNNSTDGEVRLAVSDSNLSFGPAQIIAPTGIGYGRTIPAMPEEEVTANLSLVADPLQTGVLYAVFTQAGDRLDVVLSRSVDSGKTWSTPVPVSDITAGDQFHGVVDVSPKGALSIGYRDTRHSLGNETVLVRLAQSGDGGQSFTHSIVSTVPSNDSRSNPNRDTTSNLGTRIGLKVVNGVPVVVWTDTRNGNEDIFLK